SPTSNTSAVWVSTSVPEADGSRSTAAAAALTAVVPLPAASAAPLITVPESGNVGATRVRRLMSAVVPAATSPSVHVRTAPETGAAGTAVTYSKPAASVSVTTTLRATTLPAGLS